VHWKVLEASLNTLSLKTRGASGWKEETEVCAAEPCELGIGEVIGRGENQEQLEAYVTSFLEARKVSYLCATERPREMRLRREPWAWAWGCGVGSSAEASLPGWWHS
jgi:hypothetical protein